MPKASACSTDNIEASEKRGLDCLRLHQSAAARQTAKAITGPACGLDRFLSRGLEKASAEWALMATTHIIGKPSRAAQAAV